MAIAELLTGGTEMKKKKIAELAVLLCIVAFLVYAFNNVITPGGAHGTNTLQTETNAELETAPIHEQPSSEAETESEFLGSEHILEQISPASEGSSDYGKTGSVVVVKVDAEGNLTQVPVPEWNYMADDYYKRTVTRKYDIPISEERIKKWHELYKQNITVLDPNDYFEVGEIMIIEDDTFDLEDFQYHYAFQVKNMTVVDTVETGSGAFTTLVTNPFKDVKELKAGYYTEEGDPDKIEKPYGFLDVEISITNRKSKTQLCHFRYPTLNYWEDYEGERVLTGRNSVFLDGSKDKMTFSKYPIYVSAPEVLGNSFYRLEPGEEKIYHAVYCVDPEILEQCVLIIVPAGGGSYSYGEDNFLIAADAALKKAGSVKENR